MEFPYESNKEFNGILNYLRSKSNGKIESEVNITASTYQNSHEPWYVVLYEDQSKQFFTNNTPNSWICFDFKDHKVIPTNYTCKAHDTGLNGDHPKSWVIEGSNDNKEWTVIDEQKDSDFLNGSYLVHTFNIENKDEKKFQYIKMRLIGPNCNNCHEIKLNAFELYGVYV